LPIDTTQNWKSMLKMEKNFVYSIITDKKGQAVVEIGKGDKIYGKFTTDCAYGDTEDIEVWIAEKMLELGLNGDPYVKKTALD